MYKRQGFHWNFAPVVDVDTNPQNPVIGERSFSRDAAVVARVGARFIEGIQGAGVAASAKHFPGHGDTDVDLSLIHIWDGWRALCPCAPSSSERRCSLQG